MLEKAFKIEKMTDATPEQKALLEAWLK